METGKPILAQATQFAKATRSDVDPRRWARIVGSNATSGAGIYSAHFGLGGSKASFSPLTFSPFWSFLSEGPKRFTFCLVGPKGQVSLSLGGKFPGRYGGK